jgi:ribosome modulation factor
MARKPSTSAPDAPKRPRGRPRKVVPIVAAAEDNGPTNDRITEVLAEYTQLDTAGRRINQQKNTVLSNFEKEGGDKSALKALHRALSLDPAEASAKLGRVVRYQASQGISLRWQPDGQSTIMDHLAPGPAPAAHPGPHGTTFSTSRHDLDKARAHTDGYNSGVAGAAPSDNPFQHIVGSEVYAEWHRGRDEGQQDRLRRNPVLSDRIAGSVSMNPEMPPASEASPPAA